MNSKILFNLICTGRKNAIFNNLVRFIHQSSNRKSYGGDGKTTALILNKEADLGLMIDGYSEVGFRLNNNITVLGSMLIFPRSVLSWSVHHVTQISDESLSLFTILEPRVDIIVLGIGDKTNNLFYSKTVLNFMKKNNVALEILPTAQACPTFNFLNSEGRFVVGALIPPSIIDDATDDDMLRTKLRYQNIYETD